MTLPGVWVLVAWILNAAVSAQVAAATWKERLKAAAFVKQGVYPDLMDAWEPEH